MTSAETGIASEVQAYHEAKEEAAAIRHELETHLSKLKGFLKDLESASHHLSFHGDGTYTRGEACTISLEDMPDFEAAIETRKRWEAARTAEREAYGALSSEQRVALSAAAPE